MAAVYSGKVHIICFSKNVSYLHIYKIPDKKTFLSQISALIDPKWLKVKQLEEEEGFLSEVGTFSPSPSLAIRMTRMALLIGVFQGPVVVVVCGGNLVSTAMVSQTFCLKGTRMTIKAFSGGGVEG